MSPLVKKITAGMKNNLYMSLFQKYRETGTLDIENLIGLISSMGLPDFSQENAEVYLKLLTDVIQNRNMPSSVKATLVKQSKSYF